MRINEILKSENSGKKCSMYFKEKVSEIENNYTKVFKGAIIDKSIDEKTLGIIIDGPQKLYIEELYTLYEIVNAEFRLEDIYCYIRCTHGYFVCFLEDKECFLKKYKNSSVIMEGSKEEIENYAKIKINTDYISMP